MAWHFLSLPHISVAQVRAQDQPQQFNRNLSPYHIFLAGVQAPIISIITLLCNGCKIQPSLWLRFEPQDQPTETYLLMIFSWQGFKPQPYLSSHFCEMGVRPSHSPDLITLPCHVFKSRVQVPVDHSLDVCVFALLPLIPEGVFGFIKFNTTTCYLTKNKKWYLIKSMFLNSSLQHYVELTTHSHCWHLCSQLCPLSYTTAVSWWRHIPRVRAHSGQQNVSTIGLEQSHTLRWQFTTPDCEGK